MRNIVLAGLAVLAFILMLLPPVIYAAPVPRWYKPKPILPTELTGKWSWKLYNGNYHVFLSPDGGYLAQSGNSVWLGNWRLENNTLIINEKHSDNMDGEFREYRFEVKRIWRNRVDIENWCKCR